MKNLLLGSALALSTLAVVMPTQNAMAQEVATIGGIGDGLGFLARRIHSIDIGTLAYEMEQDGVQSRSYVATFSVEGSMINNSELSGYQKGLDEVGRGPGFNILPYKVTVASDGRMFVSVAAAAFKNMNKAYGTLGSTDRGTYSDELWTIVNNVELLVYEYSDGILANYTVSHSLDILKAEAKLDILGSSKPGHYLAIVGGGSFGIRSEQITKDGVEYNIINHEGDTGFGSTSRQELSARYKVGLEYNLPISSKSGLNIEANINGGRHVGRNYKREERLATEQNNANLQNQYDVDSNTYSSNKFVYEQENFDGTEISHETYTQLTGNSRPSKPDLVDYKGDVSSRTYMFVSPSIKYSGNMGKEDSYLGYELSVFGNIPLRNDYQANSISIDLSNTNSRPLIGAGIKLKF